MEASHPAPAHVGRFPALLRTAVLVLVTAAIIGLVAFLLGRPVDDVAGQPLTGAVAGAPPRAGEVPPDFSVTTTSGDVVRLADLKGRPVWLTFGASWCSECRAEAPDIEAAYQRYRDDGLVVLAVFQESVDSAADYASRIGLTITMAVDPDARVADAYHVLGIPTHVFIGADGLVQSYLIGGLRPEDMDQQLAQLVN